MLGLADTHENDQRPVYEVLKEIWKEAQIYGTRQGCLVSVTVRDLF